MAKALRAQAIKTAVEINGCRVRFFYMILYPFAVEFMQSFGQAFQGLVK